MGADASTRPRIFIEPGGYRRHNVGDAAVLQFALAKLRARWPSASVMMHSLDPEWIDALDPSIAVLDPLGSQAWCAGAASRANQILRRRAPGIFRRLVEAGLWAKGYNPRLVGNYLNAIRHADLVLVTGDGSLNDTFAPHALKVLETLQLATEAGAVTALMSQGVGPLSQPHLRQRAFDVLRRVNGLSLRDGAASLTLLQAIGFPDAHVTVSGDDGVSAAFHARPRLLGAAIGVNLRVASYSAMTADVVAGVSQVVRDAADRYAAPLVRVPISRAPEEDDWQIAGALTGDTPADGPGQAPTTPAEVLKTVAACRLVVTGSYHAAVFGLSMGIPAVTIASSAYYEHKFRGLAGQFGPACRVERTATGNFLTRLHRAIDEAWQSAEDTRAELCEAAVRQMALGDAAYQRVFDLVDARRAIKSSPVTELSP